MGGPDGWSAKIHAQLPACCSLWWQPGLSCFHGAIRHVAWCSGATPLFLKCVPATVSQPAFFPFQHCVVLGGHRVSKLRGKLRQDVGPEWEEENVQAVPFSQGWGHLPSGETDALPEERDIQVPDQRGCSRVHGSGDRVPSR